MSVDGTPAIRHGFAVMFRVFLHRLLISILVWTLIVPSLRAADQTVPAPYDSSFEATTPGDGKVTIGEDVPASRSIVFQPAKGSVPPSAPAASNNLVEITPQHNLVEVPVLPAAAVVATSQQPTKPEVQKVDTANAKTPAKGEAGSDDPNRVVLNADRLSYDQDLDTVTARGNVQLAQNNQVLTADVVSYNQNTDRITASGHVIMQEESGTIFLW